MWSAASSIAECRYDIEAERESKRGVAGIQERLRK